MMEISQLKEFFSNLSRVSKLGFVISNSTGMLFSSETDRTKAPCPMDIQGLSSRIIQKGKFLHTLSEDKYRLFGIPLRNGEEITGSLITYDIESDRISKTEGASIAQHAHTKEVESYLTHLAALLEDKWTSQRESEKMAEEIDHSFEELYLYSKIATQIKTLKFSGAMQKDLIEDLVKIMRVDLAFTALPNHDEYNVIAGKPEISDKIPDQKEFLESLLNSIPKRASGLEDHYFIVNDSRTTPGYSKLHPDPYRFLAVKMQHKTDLYGWLGLVSFNLNELFRQSELSLLITMAEQIAVVIANSVLYHDLERFVINVVKSLVYAIEAKDVYTRGHSERVNRYCAMMAERMGMEEHEKDVLHWASILHDVGKIGIPEAILNKPGRLTKEEYDVIKSHPKKGYEILQPIEQLSSSLDGILHHHERYDGNGYPSGLKGEEIPLTGRIIAVADTFDAITSTRAYRSEKTSEEAMAIVEEVSGSQLDSGLVELFKEAINEDSLLKRERAYVG